MVSPWLDLGTTTHPPWDSSGCDIPAVLLKLGRQRYAVAGILGFDAVHTAMNDATLNQKCQIGKVEIPPLEAHDLTRPQTQTASGQNRRAIRFLNMGQQFMKLLGGENGWPHQALGHVSYPHQFHRVGID